MSRELWLNGWYRHGNTVLIGTGVHCAGCGKFHGGTCVAFSDDWAAPEKLPDWPYNEESCPLCSLEARRGAARQPTMMERLAQFKKAKELLR